MEFTLLAFLLFLAIATYWYSEKSANQYFKLLVFLIIISAAVFVFTGEAFKELTTITIIQDSTGTNNTVTFNYSNVSNPLTILIGLSMLGVALTAGLMVSLERLGSYIDRRK